MVGSSAVLLALRWPLLTSCPTTVGTRGVLTTARHSTTTGTPSPTTRRPRVELRLRKAPQRPVSPLARLARMIASIGGVRSLARSHSRARVAPLARHHRADGRPQLPMSGHRGRTDPSFDRGCAGGPARAQAAGSRRSGAERSGPWVAPTARSAAPSRETTPGAEAGAIPGSRPPVKDHPGVSSEKCRWPDLP